MKKTYALQQSTIISKLRKASSDTDVAAAVIAWTKKGCGLLDDCSYNKEENASRKPSPLTPPYTIVSGLIVANKCHVLIDLLTSNSHAQWRSEVGLAETDLNNYNLYGYGLLHYAAFLDNDAAISLLLKSGLNIEGKDGARITPLGLSVQCARVTAVKALSGAGASWTAQQLIERNSKERGWEGVYTATETWAMAWIQSSEIILKESILKNGIPSLEKWNTVKCVSSAPCDFVNLPHALKSFAVAGLYGQKKLAWWKEIIDSGAYDALFIGEHKNKFEDFLIKNAPRTSTVFSAFMERLNGKIKSPEDILKHGMELLEKQASVGTIKAWFDKTKRANFFNTKEVKNKRVPIDKNGFHEAAKVDLWSDIVIKRPELVSIFSKSITNEMCANFWKDLDVYRECERNFNVYTPARLLKWTDVNLSKTLIAVLDAHCAESPEVKNPMMIALWSLVGSKTLNSFNRYKGILQWAVSRELIPIDAVLYLIKTTPQEAGYHNVYMQKAFDVWAQSLERTMLMNVSKSVVEQAAALAPKKSLAL